MAPRFLVAALLPVLVAGVGCATGPTRRTPVPPSSPDVQAELGERNVVDSGAEYAHQNGLVLAKGSEGVRFEPNYWRIRFGLPQQGSGKLLDLQFDELAERVTGGRRLEINPPPVPTTGIFQPSDSSPATGGSGP
ncbi:hypothetical protein [Corallococcus sp. Z5C101001]|uniref:hypothetical protein n=1 Tax=Corallococcus sp. Z5C101001 TaxID=2596829 RepID=UPI00117CE205|nr:hypothetical protein [Corallococcus sp. Z5C101001]TSC29360.1 hypothetical protein FOF48_15660 [Corallococcus sp. Z5C101001]